MFTFFSTFTALFILPLLPLLFILSLKKHRNSAYPAITAFTFSAISVIPAAFIEKNILNQLLLKLSQDTFFPEAALIDSAVTALTEEFLKIAIITLLFLYILKKKQNRPSLKPAIITASAAAIGFAWAENILYFIKIIEQGHGTPAFNYIATRGLIPPIIHLLSTTAAATAILIPLTTPGKKAKTLLPVRLIAAIGIHFLYNFIIFSSTYRFAQQGKKAFVISLLILCLLSLWSLFFTIKKLLSNKEKKLTFEYFQSTNQEEK